MSDKRRIEATHLAYKYSQDLSPDKVPPQVHRDFIRLRLFCFGNFPGVKQKEASQSRQELCIPQLDGEFRSVGMIEDV
jgi:hypothetical protein